MDYVTEKEAQMEEKCGYERERLHPWDLAREFGVCYKCGTPEEDLFPCQGCDVGFVEDLELDLEPGQCESCGLIDDGCGRDHYGEILCGHQFRYEEQRARKEKLILKFRLKTNGNVYRIAAVSDMYDDLEMSLREKINPIIAKNRLKKLKKIEEAIRHHKNGPNAVFLDGLFVKNADCISRQYSI